MFLVVAGAVASLTATVAFAFATPASKVTAVPHAVGVRLAGDVKVNADRIKFQTKDPVDVSVVTLTVEPGGTTGWHSHPGFAVIAVTQGTGTLYSADCQAKTFDTGQAFVESGDDPPTVFRNESTETVVLTVSFFAPRGADLRREETNPGCAVS